LACRAPALTYYRIIVTMLAQQNVRVCVLSAHRIK
jgi:hypothetical protein